jgi:hypothetical protein
VDNVICVGTTDASCTPGQEAATISAAVVAANANSLDDTILVGPGTYDGAYQLDGSVHALTLKARATQRSAAAIRWTISVSRSGEVAMLSRTCPASPGQ